MTGHIDRTATEMMTDDRTIIQAIGEEPEKGFRLLMSSYGEPVYWHIRRLVVSHDDAEDAAQETFVRIFRNFSQYDSQNSLRAWIYRIATREALRLLGQRKGGTLSLEDATETLLDSHQDAYFVDSDELVVRLQRAILRLPAKQQLAFNLRYYDEMSYEEIAEVAGSSASSAKVNYHLAKEKIIRYMNLDE